MIIPLCARIPVHFRSLFCTSAFLLLTLFFFSAPALAATIVVPPGGDVQGALNSANCGDTVALQAGATFNTTFSIGFGDKGCSDSNYITLTTNDPSSIPAPLRTYPSSYSGDGSFTRITRAMAAPMPKIVAVGSEAALYFVNNAHHWKIVGLDISNSGTTQYNVLVQGGSNVHHIIFDQNFVHPAEEDGTMNDIQYRSAENAFILNADNITWTRNAIQGWTGYNKFPTPGLYRLNANSILAVVLTNSTIENNLLEANGQVFFGGGGGPDPRRTATASNCTFTSCTFSNTTDLDVGDLFAIWSEGVNAHLQPNDQTNPTQYIPRTGGWINGRITSVNPSTGAVTFTHLTGGLAYRMFNLYRFGATGGSFRLTFMGQQTAPIAWNAGKAEVRAALESLSTLEPADFNVRDRASDGWPYADFLIEIGRNELGQQSGQWQYPTLINPITVQSSLTGASGPAFIGNHSAESYTPAQNSADGTINDVPRNGATVTWEGIQSHHVVVRRNIIAHHEEWTNAVGSVKGFAEQKGCDHCTWDGNVFSGQATGFVFTVRNQGGSAPWASNSYTNLTNNLFEQCGGTFAMANTDGAYQTDPSHDITVSNNLCMWPGGTANPPTKWMGLQGGYNINITHNTVFSGQYLIHGISYDPVTSGTVIKDNIFRPYGYLVPCSDGTNPCWPGAVVSNNLILNDAGLNPDFINGWFITFGANTAWVETSLSAVGFTAPRPDLRFADYRLRPDSLYHSGNARQASDGKDVGVDYDQLVAALGFNPWGGPVPSPTPTPPPPPTPTPTPTPLPGGNLPIQGFVLNEAGQTLGNAVMTIQNTSQQFTTSADGFFYFNNAPIGNNLVATYPGKTFNPTPITASPENYFIRATSGAPLPTPTPTTIQLATAVQNFSEEVGSVSVVVNRTGDTTGASTVAYTTSDLAGANLCSVNNGNASSRCDYLITLGTLSFAAGETTKTLKIPLIDDTYAEGVETFSITLTNPTGAVLGTVSASTLNINGNEPLSPNPISDAAFFVRQHYVDFLNREPDAGGLAFWTSEIASCGADAGCIEVKSINVSAAFFLSIEFQNTGYLIYRINKSSFGNLATPPGAPVPVTFIEFLRDTQKIGQGVVVGAADWENQLEANKQAFTLAFVQRADFLAAYPNTMTAAEFVDKLNLNSGGVLSAAERTDLINLLGATPANVNSRSAVLRAVSEDTELKAAESNKAFVLMQYFGYLRRNPNDIPDGDYSGFNFWLNKLNSFGNFVNGEMVKAFILSGEYRQRFGP